MMLDLLAASLLAAPVPIPAHQPGPPQYPTHYLRENVSAAAALELVIDERGKVENCRILSILGDEQFARSFCKLMQRSRWRPATDAGGKASVGVVRTMLSMFIPGTVQGNAVRGFQLAPDIQLEISQPSGSASLPAEIKVALQANEAGAFTACEPQSDPATSPALRRVACEQALKVTRPPLLRKDGQPGSFVTEFKIRFVPTPTRQ